MYSSFVFIFILGLFISIALLWGIVSVYRTHNFACVRFSADLTISLENGEMILIIWVCFVSSVDMFAFSAFLNFVSVSISTS